jgi:hypothetical protein
MAELTSITYAWADGKQICLSIEDIDLVRSYAKDREHFGPLLHHLASLPGAPKRQDRPDAGSSPDEPLKPKA